MDLCSRWCLQVVDSQSEIVGVWFSIWEILSASTWILTHFYANIKRYIEHLKTYTYNKERLTFLNSWFLVYDLHCTSIHIDLVVITNVCPICGQLISSNDSDLSDSFRFNHSYSRCFLPGDSLVLSNCIFIVLFISSPPMQMSALI